MQDAVSIIRDLLKKYLEKVHPIAQDRKLPTPEMLKKEVRRYE